MYASVHSACRKDEDEARALGDCRVNRSTATGCRDDAHRRTRCCVVCGLHHTLPIVRRVGKMQGETCPRKGGNRSMCWVIGIAISSADTCRTRRAGAFVRRRQRWGERWRSRLCIGCVHRGSLRRRFGPNPQRWSIGTESPRVREDQSTLGLTRKRADSTTYQRSPSLRKGGSDVVELRGHYSAGERPCIFDHERLATMRHRA